MTKQETVQIMVKPINLGILKVKIKSMENSPMIMHKLSNTDFIKRETGEPDKTKLRDFKEEYESCFHYTEDGSYGFPVEGFMGGILDACVPLNIPKTQIKRAVRILGRYVKINCKKIERVIDNPRRSGKNSTPDERHRPYFYDWNAELVFQYDKDLISPEQIINLVNQAGFSTGVGDWRPQRGGSKGMYQVIG